jgi:hypothetical protein
MIRLLEEVALTPEEQAEADAVFTRSSEARRAKQNPWVAPDGDKFVVKFVPPQFVQYPLEWTDSGFKNLLIVNKDPEYFATKAEAEKKIRGEILDYIRKYRRYETHLIIGW